MSNLVSRKKRQSTKAEVLTTQRQDRRILSNVPDPEQVRVNPDRRGMQQISDEEELMSADYLNRLRDLSLRYMADFAVQVVPPRHTGNRAVDGRAVDISSTGMLFRIPRTTKRMIVGARVGLRFRIPPGTMPEGFESVEVKIRAAIIRTFKKQHEGEEYLMVAVQFEKPLLDYFQRKRWGYSVYSASGLLFFAMLFIVLLRAESVVYFRYNSTLYLYSLIAAFFLLSRYMFGALYREVKINPDYTPAVTIIIPCFNEEEWIHRTVLSCMNQEYPPDKLEVIVVDDYSTDRSVERINEVIELIHKEADRYNTKERLKLHVLPQNGGKREALVAGVRMAKHDLVVFVDSDSFLEPTAIRHLVQPFQDPQMGGVAGRTDVENKYTNSLTKLQTVRYYIAFRIMKAAESYFDSVTCLSGPLSCYRKDLVLLHSEAWLTQKFLGQPATFGDDRSMTNYILRTHRTCYQDSAICSTIVPSKMPIFLKQQMRWKRSWLRESLRAGGFIWRKEPFMSLFFYTGLVVPIAAPIVVLYNLMYVPLVHGIFPTTFLVGLLMMAMLMSLAHLLFRKSKLWVFGFVFCLVYEFILLWQMPVAWFTFWKSTWGTRDTPQDVKAREKKMRRNRKRQLDPGSPGPGLPM